MSRLIDADALISDLEYDIKIDEEMLDYEDLTDINRKNIQNDKDCKQNAVDILKSTPTVDAVPVVRCIECKYASFSFHQGELYISCENNEGLFRDVPEDGYCYCGEKVTE